MAFNPKKPNLGINGPFYNPIYDVERQNQQLRSVVLSSPAGIESFFSERYIRPRIDLEKIELKRQQDYNYSLNSLKALTRGAFQDTKYADDYAVSMLSRITNAKSNEELNSITKDLEGIKEKASLRSSGLYIDSDDSSFTKGLKKFSQNALDIASKGGKALTPLIDMFGDGAYRKSLQGKEELLRNTNDFSKLDLGTQVMLTQTFGQMDQDEYLKSILSKNILPKQNELNALKLYSQIPNFTQELSKSLNNPNKKNAFNNLLKTKIELDRNVRGNELYRDNQEDINEISKGINRALSAGESDYFNNSVVKERDNFFKYSQEKDLLSSLQFGLNKELNILSEEINQIKKTKSPNDPTLKPILQEKEAKLKELKNNYTLLEGRKGSLKQIYGIEDQSGVERSLGSLLYNVSSVGDFLNDDFYNVTKNISMYQPKYVGEDKYGNPIYSNQFSYTKQDGSVGYNWTSVPELGFGIVGQILPTIAVSNFTGGLVTGLSEIGLKVASAAQKISAGYDAFNKYGGLKLADRLSTLTSVSLTTMPMMIEEEKRWGGDYIKRGAAKSIIEGITEAVGFPDVGALKAKSFVLDLGTASKKIANQELRMSDKFLMGLKASPRFIKESFKQNAVEAFEEEMSLLGNAILEHTMFDQSMFEKDGRERTEFTGANIYDTFVESFAAGSIYSGGTSLLSAKNTLRNDNITNLANWQAANNPELFKAKLSQLKENGRITEDQFKSSLLRVNELSTLFESQILSFANLKDTRSLMDDKDQQYSLFTALVKRNDIIQIDYDSLSDEDKEVLGKTKVKNLLHSEKYQKDLNKLREEISVLENKENKTKQDELKLKLLSASYLQLKKLRVKREDLNNEDLDTLKSLGIITDDNLLFTPEDYAKELANIDKSILKAKKQVDKYVNLTEDQKDQAIVKLFESTINDVDKINDPFTIEQTMIQLRKDLEYMKSKESNVRPIEIEQREKLYDALDNKYTSLIERGEDGFNEVERYFETENYLSEVKDTNNIFKLINDIRFLENNKMHIDESYYNTVMENLNKIYNDNVDFIRDMTTEERIEVLANFYEKLASQSPRVLYSAEATNEFFKYIATYELKQGEEVVETRDEEITPEFTEEEVDAAREKVIADRAKRNSQNIAQGKKPYDKENQTEEPEEETTEEEEEESEDFKKDLNDLKQVVNNISEDKPIIDDEGNSDEIDYINQLFEKNKKGGLKKLKQLAKNIISQSFQYNPSFNSGYNLMMELNEKVFNGQIDQETFNLSIDDLIKRFPKKANTITLYQALILKIYNEDLLDFVAGAGSVVKTKDDTEDTKTSQSNQSQSSMAQQDPAVKQRDVELDREESAKINQLVDFLTPLKTVAVELNRNDEPSTDPVSIRRVNQINQMTDSEFSQKPMLALMNRQKFMISYLEVKYPNKSKDDILNDLKVINDFFENSNEGDPLPSEVIALIGEDLFSVSQITTWQKNKGKGFSQSPDIVVSLVEPNNKIYLFDGSYPLDLNMATVSEERKNDVIPWNYSKRRMNQLKKDYGVTEKQIYDAHKNTWEQIQAAKEKLSKDNNLVITSTSYSISNGVLVGVSNYELGQTAKETNEVIKNASLEDFKIATEKKSTLFGRQANFDLGRLYFNNNGDPIQLNNKTFSKEESEALGELVFNPDFPIEFDEIKDFQNYLFNLINDVSKDFRLYFKPNREYGKEGEFHTNILLKEKGKLRQLNKEEFVDYLQKSYYKVSKEYLNANKSIYRYELIDGKINVIKQSYLDYILSTHEFPIKDGVINKNVNKNIYFKIPNVQGAETITTKKVVVKQAIPSTPTSNLGIDSDGFIIIAKSESETSTLPIGKLPFYQFFIPSRNQILQLLKSAGKGPNSQEFFSNMTDEDFENYINGFLSKRTLALDLLIIDPNGKAISSTVKETFGSGKKDDNSGEEFINRVDPKDTVQDVIEDKTVNVLKISPGNYAIFVRKVKNTDGTETTDTLMIPLVTKEEAAYSFKYQTADAAIISKPAVEVKPKKTIIVDGDPNQLVEEEDDLEFESPDEKEVVDLEDVNDSPFVDDEFAVEDENLDFESIDESKSEEQTTQPTETKTTSISSRISRLNNNKSIDPEISEINEQAYSAKANCEIPKTNTRRKL